MAWVGAIVVVLGAAFLVKLGIEAGLWGKLPAVARCLLVAGFGALLIVGGEVALRRIGPAASVGLYGAGLGTLYLDAFATFEWFTSAPGPPPVPLVSREWSFILMGVVAVIGFAITLRTRFLTIGILSIIGGYLTPFLLAGGLTHTIEVGTYLTMLLGISLGLSLAMPNRFRPLRYVAIGGQGALGLAWALNAPPALWVATVVFLSMWWTMVLIEGVVAALRKQSPGGNVVVSLLATAGFVTLGCWILQDTQPSGVNWLGLFTLAVGMLAAAAALQFGPGLDGLRQRPRSAMDKLAVALWAQAGVLLAVAAALQFDGYGQSVSWLAIGLASVEIGRRLPSRGLDVFGLIVTGLALLRVSFLDSWSSTLDTPIYELASLEVDGWAILAAIAVVVTHVIAARFRTGERAGSKPWPIILAVVGTLLWMGLCQRNGEDLVVTGGWLLGAAVLLGLHRFARRQRYFELALLLLVATAGRWLIVDAVAVRFAPGWEATDATPLFNWQMGLAAAIAAMAWPVWRVLRGRALGSATAPGSEEEARLSRGWQIAMVTAVGLVLVAFSFEVDRAVVQLVAAGTAIAWPADQLRTLYLTMLWTVGSVGLGLLARSLAGRDVSGVIRVPQLLMRFAWGLLAVCAAKWIIGDTLYYTFWGHGLLRTALAPLVNIQMLAGLGIAVAAVAIFAVSGSARQVRLESTKRPAVDWMEFSGWLDVTAWVPVAAAVLILWGLTFEVDRLLARFEAGADWDPTWQPVQLRALWWTGLWAAGGLATMLWGRWRTLGSMLAGGWLILALAALAWLSYDTIAWRLTEGKAAGAPVVLNLQFGIGLLVAIILAFGVQLLRSTGRPETPSDPARAPVMTGLAIIAAIGLWLGSLEIDRFLADEPNARQTGLSIFWGLYAIALLAVGFRRRSAMIRYVGLALLTLTVGKVLVIDLARVPTVYRVVSFLGVGLLLVATSVAYSKLAPKLLGGNEPTDSEKETRPHAAGGEESR